MLNRGWRSPDGEDVQGLRDLLDRLRREREEPLDRGDLGGAYREIAEELDQVLAEERAGIDACRTTPGRRATSAARRSPTRWPTERRMQLDLLPPDLAGTVRGLQALRVRVLRGPPALRGAGGEARAEVAKTYFDQVSEALADPDPEQLAHLREAFDALNRMLEQREAGEPIDPSFESFMERFGDVFPGDPADLDELLEQLAARMAAAQAMWNSMSPEQRAQLQGLAESLLEDIDLRWQVDRLAENLRKAVPDAGWEQRYRFSGDEPLGLGRAPTPRKLRDLDELEAYLRSASSPAALSEVDLDKVARHLGEDAARSLERLARLTKQLTDAGLIDQREGAFELTPAGTRRIGQQALSRPVRPAEQGPGRQPPHRAGGRRSRPRGDDQALRVRGPLQPRPVTDGAQRRPPAGQGVPVRLTPDDFEVIETEALARTATVLLLDLSLSMPMRDNFVPAKKMALALHTLITSRFPRDYLGLVGFSEVARVIEPEDLPTVSWDYVYGTNLQHGADPGPQDAGPPAGDEADHPGDRRRAHGPPRPLRPGPRLRRLLQLPPGPRDARGHLGRGHAVHTGGHHHQHVPAGPRPGAEPGSSSSWPVSTGGGPSPPRRANGRLRAGGFPPSPDHPPHPEPPRRLSPDGDGRAPRRRRRPAPAVPGGGAGRRRGLRPNSQAIPPCVCGVDGER